MNRLLVISISVLVLAACSLPQRTEPPAPVVRVSAPPAPVEEPKPKPQSVEPKVQPVQVYAYQHPGELPAIPPDSTEQQTAAPDGASGGPGAVADGQASQGVPGPAGPEPGASQQTAAASAGSQQQPSPAAPAKQSPPPQAAAAPPAPKDSASAALSPATQALAQQAEQQRQMGDYAGAAATLERGLRISPQEAYLWNRLARVRLEQGLHSQAANLAARSNSLAGNQGTLKQDNWRIIADARRGTGDVTGAQEAELKARGG